MVLPHTLSPLLPSSDGRGQGPPHMRAYCEMCRLLGYNCSDVEDEENKQIVCSSSRLASYPGVLGGARRERSLLAPPRTPGYEASSRSAIGSSVSSSEEMPCFIIVLFLFVLAFFMYIFS